MAPPLAPRRPTRHPRHQEPIIGGVAAGLARHLGVPALWVRVAFILPTALGGLGVFLYAGLWMVLPAGPPSAAPGHRGRDAAAAGAPAGSGD